MPDLGDLAPVPVLSHYEFKVVFQGTGMPDNRTHLAYIVSFIRILDKAIYEYDQSRKELQAYLGSANRTTLIMKAVSHLETCVNSLHRCLLLFERMKQLRLGDVPELRQLRKLLESNRVVEDVRDVIEHMDERIAGGKIAECQPIALMINEAGDRSSIAGEQVRFSDLASTIRKLHAVAVQLCDYSDPVVNP